MSCETTVYVVCADKLEKETILSYATNEPTPLQNIAWRNKMYIKCVSVFVVAAAAVIVLLNKWNSTIYLYKNN
jgi:hypothetical protein